MAVMLKPQKPGPTWRFFSSIWLAVGLMAFVGAVCALGTMAGVEEAEVVFYRAEWFALILGALMLNLTICTLNRSSKPLHSEKGWTFPWRLSQIPFLLVHLGLLLLFSGAIYTKTSAFDGQLMLSERPSKDRRVPDHRSNRLLKKDRTIQIHAMLPKAQQGSYLGYSAVSINLNNGRSLQGKVVDEIGSDQDGQLVLLTDDGKISVERSEIQHISVKEAKRVFLNYLDPSEKLERFSQRIVWVGVLVSLLFLGLTFLLAYLFSDGAAPIITTFVFVSLVFSVGVSLPSFEQKIVGDNLTMTYKKYYPHAWKKQTITNQSKEANPALRIRLGREKLWLFHEPQAENLRIEGKEPFETPISYGPYQINYIRAKNPEELETRLVEGRKTRPRGRIRIFSKNKPGLFQEVFDDDFAGKTVTVAGQAITITKIFQDFRTRQVKGPTSRAQGPTSRPEKPGKTASVQFEFYDSGELHNPAVEYSIGQEAESRISFAWYLQFNEMLSRRRPENKDIGVVYFKPRPLGQSSISFVRYDNGDLAVVVLDKNKPAKIQDVKQLENFEAHIAGRPLDVQILQVLENLEIDENLKPVTMGEHDKWQEFQDAIFVEVRDAKNNKAEGWLRFGQRLPLTIGEHKIILQYNYETRTLPFSLQLDHFEVETHPGTSNPSEFRSTVTVFDTIQEKSMQFEADIYMNHTLDYRGYRFFQSSYSMIPGQPKVSIFSVTNDPGTPYFYAGCIILCFGVLVIFFVKPSLIKVERRLARIEAGLPAEGPLTKEDIARAKERAHENNKTK
jgi:hypothetical protein